MEESYFDMLGNFSEKDCKHNQKEVDRNEGCEDWQEES